MKNKILSTLSGIPESELRTRLKEIFTYFCASLQASNLPETKFIIFAHWRTGSNLLADLLNSHPDITCESEILLPFILSRVRKVIFPYLYIKGRSVRAKTKVYGFNLKLYQLNDLLTKFHGDPKSFMLSLHKKGWKIIHLKRINALKQTISFLIADKSKQWHHFANKPLTYPRVNINCESLIKKIRRIEKFLAEEEIILKDIPHITVIYENDLLRSKDHQGTLDKIFKYLNLSSMPVKTKFKRVSSDAMSNYIENHEEVVKVVSNTEYARFIEDSQVSI